MTMFEEFAQEMGIKITLNKRGLFDGMSAVLARMTNDIILSDDEKVFNLPWEQQKEMIREKFYKVFPYARALAK